MACSVSRKESPPFFLPLLLFFSGGGGGAHRLRGAYAVPGTNWTICTERKCCLEAHKMYSEVALTLQFTDVY